MSRIGVGISGGGHRASVWGIGSLLYLVHAGLNSQVVSIGSVSGGSFTNAWVGLDDTPFTEIEPDPFDRHVGRLASSIAARPRLWQVAFFGHLSIMGAAIVSLVGDAPLAIVAGLFTAGIVWPAVLGPRSGGALWSWWGIWVYLALLVPAVVAVVAVWWLPWPGSLRLLVFLVACGLFAVVGSFRNYMAGLAIDRFLPSHVNTVMSDLQSDPLHIFCATELHGGHHIYFGQHCVTNYEMGIGDASDLPLRVAVQSSANLPGAFPPRIIRARPLGFRFERSHPTGCRWDALARLGILLTDRFGGRLLGRVGDRLRRLAERRSKFARLRPARWLALTDGGVYDNMATQWAMGQERRIKQLATAHAAVRDDLPDDVNEHLDLTIGRMSNTVPDVIVAVNASADLGWRGLRRLWVPGLGELLGLAKVKDVLYDNGTSTRRRLMMHQFINDDGVNGTIVQIEHSPYRLTRKFKWGAMGGRAADARKALDAAGHDDRTWEAAAKSDARVSTTLNPLGRDQVVQLLLHSYLLTMVNLHILLDYPLLTIPTRADFERLLDGDVLPGRRPLVGATH